MITPREYDAMLGQLLVLQAAVESALRTLQLMKPSGEAAPIQDHTTKERVTKVFGGEHRVTLSPEEAAAAATAPAERQGYISEASQGDPQGLATSGKADGR